MGYGYGYPVAYGGYGAYGYPAGVYGYGYPVPVGYGACDYPVAAGYGFPVGGTVAESASVESTAVGGLGGGYYIVQKQHEQLKLLLELEYIKNKQKFV